jgi:hypothetical protein
VAKAFSYIASQKSIFPNLTEFKDIGFHAGVGSLTSALFEVATSLVAMRVAQGASIDNAPANGTLAATLCSKAERRTQHVALAQVVCSAKTATMKHRGESACN